MDHNRQQHDRYDQQSGRSQQGRQQDQWRDGGEMDTNYNMQNNPEPHPGYGEVYHGNVKQREEETNQAQGHNYGHQGSSYQGGSQRSGQNYNPGGYGQVGNTGGGYSAWDSHGSSGNDMGGNYEGRTQGWGNSQYNTGSYGNEGGYGRQSSGYNQAMHNQGQNMGGNRYNRNQQQDDGNNWWDKAKNKVSSWLNDDDDRNDNRRNYNMHEGAMAGERRIVSNDRTGDYGHRGEHWGKGPRGYQRSEERIREDVCERLAYDGHVDASDIDVKVEGSEVILTGTVRSRAEKRRAEDLVESIMGVRNVENRIRVNHEGSSGWQAGSRTGDTSRSSSSTSDSNKGNSLQSHSYTGNSGDGTGIGTESGTTNEIIRNSGATDTNL